MMYSRIRKEGGGSCIFVKDRVQTKELNSMQGLCKEKDFEMSILELVDLKIVLVCIYRSPDGDFQLFQQNLETVIQKVQSKKKRVILCGDWNINVLEDSARSQE
jgi:exonuclease III